MGNNEKEIQTDRLLRLVRGMRILQNKYFETRDNFVLRRAKEAETRVDAVLFNNKKLMADLSIEPDVMQGNIFDADGRF